MTRISFGMIVLNGEPFLRYNLRALYPHAHQIIVVEGAVEAAKDIATETGHSRDGTLEILNQFKAEEDPDDKLVIVTRDGFWDEKDEMSQVYAEKATGDYLWQVDVDEFYIERDIQAVIAMLHANPNISQVSFRPISFWGGFDYLADGIGLREIYGEIRRIFKWERGSKYVSHRPPTVIDANGHDKNNGLVVNGKTLASRGIYLYHYSLVFPAQVRSKCGYYDKANWNPHQEMDSWARKSYFDLEDPLHVHNTYAYTSWLERYTGPHPEQIENLRKDIAEGNIQVETRRTDDIENLLNSFDYQLRRWLAKQEPMVRPLTKLSKRAIMSYRYRTGLVRKKLGIGRSQDA